MRLLKQILTTVFMSIVCAQLLAAGTTGVAAVVDGEEITERELQNALNGYMIQRGMNVGATREPDEFNELRGKILTVLINRVLLWQAAKKDDKIASSEEVDQAMAGFRAQFDSDAAFDIRLQENGYTKSSFHGELERRLSAEKWIEARAAGEISVDDAEVSRFYENNKPKFASPGEVRARHILIQLPPDADDSTTENARVMLTGLKKRVDDGEDFAALAKEFSQDSSASKGGDLGFFGPGIMVKPFEQAAFGLSPGEVSDIVETQFGLHLIQMVEKKPSGFYPLSVAEQQIRDYLYRQKHQGWIDETVRQLRENAQIEIHSL